MKYSAFLFFSMLMIGSFYGCKDNTGCTNNRAINFDFEATEDDGSCIIPGCMDPLSLNYDSTATQDDGSCVFDDTVTTMVGFYTNRKDVGEIIVYLQHTNQICGTVALNSACDTVCDLWWTSSSLCYVRVGSITKSTPQPTTCDNPKVLTVRYRPGNWNMIARSENAGLEWRWKVTFERGTCRTVLLH